MPYGWENKSLESKNTQRPNIVNKNRQTDLSQYRTSIRRKTKKHAQRHMLIT